MSSNRKEKETNKRDVYTLHACGECQRRKVKCSGQHPCQNCEARSAECKYSGSHGASGKRKRRESPSKISRKRPGTERNVSVFSDTDQLREQVRRLQQGLDTLMMKQSLSLDFCAPATSPSLPSRADNVPMSPQECPFLFSQDSGIRTSQNAQSDMEYRLADQEQDNNQSMEQLYTETDMFLPVIKWMNPYAVASQISALRSSVGAKAILSTASVTRSCTVILPSSSDLTKAVKAALIELDCYFPALHGTRVMEAISTALIEMEYPSCGHNLTVSASNHLIISVLLILDAYGQLLVPQNRSQQETLESWLGSQSYWQSRKLTQYFEDMNEPQTTYLIYHAISATYLLAAERLQAASIHVLHGLHSAASIGLGQGEVSVTASEELADPLALWVMLDFLDKRITQKCGTPYYIRNGYERDDIEHRTNTSIDAVTKGYLKAVFSHSRLWATIWDTFLAPNAPMASDWIEIQVFDAKLLAMRDLTPRHLAWGVDLMNESIATGAIESSVRRGLAIVLRYQSLRLSIRHKTLKPHEVNVRRIESCLAIAIETLDIIEQYLNNWEVRSSSGYIVTSSLVESVYYITLGNREQVLSTDPRLPVTALMRAKNILRALSKTIPSAARAFKSLQCVFEFDFDAFREFDVGDSRAGFSGIKNDFNLFVGNDNTAPEARFGLSSNDALKEPPNTIPESLSDFDSLLASLVPDTDSAGLMYPDTGLFGYRN